MIYQSTEAQLTSEFVFLVLSNMVNSFEKVDAEIIPKRAFEGIKIIFNRSY